MSTSSSGADLDELVAQLGERGRRSPIGTSTLAYTPPVSSPSSTAITHTPVTVVAGEQRPLDRRRAAPTRQQREVEVDHRQLGQHVRLDELPEGDDDTELGADPDHVVDVV